MKIPTPKLPYELPVNCVLTLTDASTLKACLHYTRDKTIYKNSLGISPTVQTVRLRLVNPKFLPKTVKVESRLLATITDNATGIATNHVLVVSKIIQSQWKESTETYGAILNGYLTQESPSTVVDNDSPFGNTIPNDANPFD